MAECYNLVLDVKIMWLESTTEYDKFNNMIQNLRFYKEDSSWFADLPEYIESGGTKAQCQMVYGADTWLDIISNNSNEITLELSNEPFDGADKLSFESSTEAFEEEELGAYYRIGFFEGENHTNKRLWLCPVTLYVFGEYPKKIYYKRA